MAKHASTARRLFKGKNLITPEIIRYGWKDGLAYELATGSGFGRDAAPIFGVTVKRPNGETDDASKCCFSREEAEAYIAAGFK